ncbi:MAG: type II secretion system F family protein, partial [Rhabdochlamydiaceae bacterium]
AYPLFLGSFCSVIFISLLIWVIPSLKNLFEGRALHPLTKFVFKLSDLFLDHSILIFGGTALLALLVFIGITHPRFRASWDQLLLKLPLIGPLILLAATVRFCRTCSLLLEGGTPLLPSLQLTRAVLKNHILESALSQVEKNVAEGSSLSDQIEKMRLMPSLVSRMLAIGEKTGQNASMLKHIATLCEEDLSRTLQRYTALLQPLLLLLLGLLIGVVVLSILIPLTDIGSVLQP